MNEDRLQALGRRLAAVIISRRDIIEIVCPICTLLTLGPEDYGSSHFVESYLEGTQVKSRGEPGLVLDDFLRATDAIRKDFDVLSAGFGLKEIELYPQAKETIDTLVDAIIDRHGPCIYSQPHSLLSDCDASIYSEQIGSSVYQGYRISPDQVRSVLTKLFALALQTIVQLPVHAPKVGLSSHALTTLSSQFTKMAAKAQSVLENHEARQRVLMYLRHRGEKDLNRIFRTTGELSWASDVLTNAVSTIAVVRPKWDSPNPQVRYALYFVGWVEAATGRQHYRELSDLLTAAFHAVNPDPKKRPNWVDRLAIEMNSKRIRRKNWAKGITYTSKT